ncbi:MAG: hypothetical protein H6815_11220 [Phycisphaeraceae bacterium]|nr:hypothetical protein [Phycisphaerales bacterium]MCB9861007.1 hypothetical protein [Phycisphaeraceae bacterium]
MRHFLAVSNTNAKTDLHDCAARIAAYVGLNPVTLSSSCRWTLWSDSPDFFQSACFPTRSFEPSVAQGSVAVRIKPGERGLGRVFFAETNNARLVASQPAWLAALCQSEVDVRSMYEDLVLGYRTGSRSIFTSVQRPSESDLLLLCHDGSLQTVPDHINDMMTNNIAEQLKSSIDMIDPSVTAIELTGGVDSRLNLAVCAAANKLPKHALTIGDADNHDVLTAADLCKQFGINHITIHPADIPDPTPEDIERFVTESGYASNTVNYGWLPPVYRMIEQHRTMQITGAGGEYAGGFYSTPFDFLCGHPRIQRSWVRTRMMTQIDTTQIIQPDIRNRLDNATMDSCVSQLRSLATSWREAGNRWYGANRLRHWGAPVLWASDSWYCVHAPLLSPAYLAWCDAERSGRKGQIELIRTLHPDALNVPFANSSPDVSRLRKAATSYRKITRRLRKKHHGRPAVENRLATLLAQDSSIHTLLDNLKHALGDVFIAGSGKELASTTKHTPSVFGTLLTAAIAQRDLTMFAQIANRGIPNPSIIPVTA